MRTLPGFRINMRSSPQPLKRSASGRPPKFDEPSRPVTVTLPESVLVGLGQVHQDRGRAIKLVTERALSHTTQAIPLVEIVKVKENTGVIIIGPSRVLDRIPFLHLVEVSPGRFLLAMDPGNDYKNLELAVRDLFDSLEADEERERELLHRLLDQIRELRQTERMSMAEILFVSLKPKRIRLKAELPISPPSL